MSSMVVRSRQASENGSDLVLDGNAAADLLHEIFVLEITVAQIQCDAASGSLCSEQTFTKLRSRRQRCEKQRKGPGKQRNVLQQKLL
jgi:hypothetical protein